MTFDLWCWADLAQNLISSSTPGDAPLYQVWWKSTHRFLRFHVNEVKIAYIYTKFIDLWPLMLGGSRPKSNQFIYSGWCTPVPKFDENPPKGFLRFRVLNEVKIAYFDQVHWPLILGGSRPKSNQFIYSWWCTLYQVWWKSTKGFLRFRVNEGKIAYFDQVHWPWVDLAKNLISSSTPEPPLHKTFCQSFLRQKSGNSGKKKNPIAICIEILPEFFYGKKKSGKKFYATGPWWCPHAPSLMKIHPGVLEILC